LELPEIDIAAFQRIGIYEMTPDWCRRATCELASPGGNESVVTVQDVQLLQEIPMVTRIFHKPPPAYQEDPSAIKDLDEVWSIVQWQESAETRERFGNLPALRPDAVYLAQQRFRDTEKSALPLSPRLAAFVKHARERQVGREAVALACMIECDAASFSPKIGISAAGHEIRYCPLLAFSRILEDVPGFIKRAEKEGSAVRKNLLDLKISIRKLNRARNLWWKIDRWSEDCVSSLTEEKQSEILVELLCKALPEQVACRVTGVWYAAGYRVRGAELQRVEDAG
jgi:hypothetical protein